MLAVNLRLSRPRRAHSVDLICRRSAQAVRSPRGSALRSRCPKRASRLALPLQIACLQLQQSNM